MEKGYVYWIINKVNNKRYIGATNDLDRRWRDHRTTLRHNTHCNKNLQEDWNNYGEENFEFILILELTGNYNIVGITKSHVEISLIDQWSNHYNSSTRKYEDLTYNSNKKGCKRRS